MAPVRDEAPAPEFPSWPLNCLTFYRHMADDYGRYMQALSSATDPAQAARAEGDYGVSLAHDLMQAWYDLALSPFTAMTKAMATGAEAADKAEAGAASSVKARR
jgi:hypothetical protein